MVWRYHFRLVYMQILRHCHAINNEFLSITTCGCAIVKALSIECVVWCLFFQFLNKVRT